MAIGTPFPLSVLLQPGIAVFRPESPQSASIANLFFLVLAVCAGILCVVAFMVATALIRFRQTSGRPDPKPNYGNWKLETAWTVIPLLVVLWLLGLTAVGLRQAAPGPDLKPDLLVVSHQWWWEARYPNSGVTVANEIHIPVGQRWLVALESADVIHDFWVPRLGPKMDAVPGHPNRLWLEADRAGSYLGTCSEYCGAQHAHMRFLVIAQPAAEFDTWQKKQREPAAPPPTQAAKEGAISFQQMSCATCHAVSGTPAQGRTAPDLSHFAGRQTFGAVLLANTPENLSRWLKDPQSIKPETQMPDLKLNDAQVHHLNAYMESLL